MMGGVDWINVLILQVIKPKEVYDSSLPILPKTLCGAILGKSLW